MIMCAVTAFQSTSAGTTIHGLIQSASCSRNGTVSTVSTKGSDADRGQSNKGQNNTEAAAARLALNGMVSVMTALKMVPLRSQRTV